jgi:hypothetical protein
MKSEVFRNDFFTFQFGGNMPEPRPINNVVRFHTDGTQFTISDAQSSVASFDVEVDEDNDSEDEPQLMISVIHRALPYQMFLHLQRIGSREIDELYGGHYLFCNPLNNHSSRDEAVARYMSDLPQSFSFAVRESLERSIGDDIPNEQDIPRLVYSFPFSDDIGEDRTELLMDWHGLSLDLWNERVHQDIITAENEIAADILSWFHHDLAISVLDR